MHGRSVATCFNLALFKFRQLVSEELEFVVVTHDHLIQSMEDAMKLMRAGGMYMTKHVSLPLQPHHVRFGTAPPIPCACATRGFRPHAPPPSWRMCHTWPQAARSGPLPGVCATRGFAPHASAPLPGACATRGFTPHPPRPPAGRMYHAWPNFARSSSCS